ncbi:PaaI family thioesterase [Parahaliea aestuarii]|uniref:PaaI family thioesterase n=1 Tax=Parahaliea aestuarii TaxID=1852021 RepID=A0A5C8ZTJ4_9GAMM|nr:PaaI family thioesterase [Parahaliea aestuarii]TXS90601.1 PaaI family thioesterase [Parahaliea aestuarii]
MIDYHKEYGHLSGLERMRLFERDVEARFGMAANLGYEVASIAEGSVVYIYTPQESHINLIGGVHGGALASLLDTAMGGAAMTTLAPGERHTIVDLAVKFLRSLRQGDPDVSVEASVEHRGRRLGTVTGRILSADGKLIASGTATAMIL